MPSSTSKRLTQRQVRAWVLQLVEALYIRFEASAMAGDIGFNMFAIS